VFFTSTQKLTDDAVDGTAVGDAAQGETCAESPAGGRGCNLYLYDFGGSVGGRLRTVSVGGEVLGVVGIAEDGSRVYYVSREAIGSAGTDPYGRAPVEGQPNLYVYDAASAKTAFVATLGGEDGGDWPRVFRRQAEVAGGSGRFLLFASSLAGMTPDDVPSRPIVQLFEYKAPGEGEAAELVRVTKGENGFNEDGNGVSTGVEAEETIAPVMAQTGRGNDFKSTTDRLNVSVDGRTVFFLTVGQLSPRATSAERECRSLYEFHAGGALSTGSVHLVSDGRDTQLYKGIICGPSFQGMSSSGADVFFHADDPLLSSDVDGVERDIYDARVGGGFGVPSAVGLCRGVSCGGMPSGQLLPATGSTGVSGEPPVAPAGPKAAVKRKVARCRRGFVKRHGKCIRRRGKAGSRTNKSAGRTGIVRSTRAGRAK
jgi:hypothetical protein